MEKVKSWKELSLREKIGQTVTITTTAFFKHLENYENPADVFICSPGDTVDIYDLKSGAYKGNARVRAVTNNADGSRTIHLYYGETIDRVSEGCVVANRDTGAPGSTITNCHFQGTFRFLRNLPGYPGSFRQGRRQGL